MPQHSWVALGLCLCVAVAGCYAQESVEDIERFGEGEHVRQGSGSESRSVGGGSFADQHSAQEGVADGVAATYADDSGSSTSTEDYERSGRPVYMDTFGDTEPQHEDTAPWYNNPGTQTTADAELKEQQPQQEHSGHSESTVELTGSAPWKHQPYTYPYSDEGSESDEDYVQEGQGDAIAEHELEGSNGPGTSRSDNDIDDVRPVAYGRKGLRDTPEDQAASAMKGNGYKTFYDSCECFPPALWQQCLVAGIPFCVFFSLFYLQASTG